LKKWKQQQSIGEIETVKTIYQTASAWTIIIFSYYKGYGVFWPHALCVAQKNKLLR
jgi:hypothetical protein